jgi:hypothetical protein
MIALLPSLWNNLLLSPMLNLRGVAKSTAPKLAIGVQSVQLNHLFSRPRVESDQDLSAVYSK